MIKSKSEIEIFQKKTKSKISFCKCNTCKLQCKTPCLGTPKDILKLCENGFADKITHTTWLNGLVKGYLDHEIEMYQLNLNSETKYCVMHENGLCQLHNLGLKPIEGKLSHHEPKVIDSHLKSLNYLVASEWTKKENFETIKKIEEWII
jgi:hypothetical protein